MLKCYVNSHFLDAIKNTFKTNCRHLLAGRQRKKCATWKRKKEKISWQKNKPLHTPETENPWGKRQRFKNKIALWAHSHLHLHLYLPFPHFVFAGNKIICWISQLFVYLGQWKMQMETLLVFAG